MRPVLGAAAALTLAAGVLQAEELPTCKVRLVLSAATEKLPPRVVGQVERWVDAPERGSELVPSIGMADVLLELTRYKIDLSDNASGEQWWFVARRLSEAAPDGATHRFIYSNAFRPGANAVLAQKLPAKLVEICQGSPKRAPARLEKP